VNEVAYDDVSAYFAYDAVPRNEPVKDPVNEPVLYERIKET
jgi:hypothetical protein